MLSVRIDSVSCCCNAQLTGRRNKIQFINTNAIEIVPIGRKSFGSDGPTLILKSLGNPVPRDTGLPDTRQLCTPNNNI